jgi:hypothetical protein
MVEADRFPRWGVLWWVVYSVEAALGSFPMVLIVPTGSAVAGSAYAISHPTMTLRHGMIVGEQPFWHALLTAVLGGLVGLCALVGAMFLGFWVWYRLLGGDRVWEAIYRGRSGQIYFFELRCKENVGAVDPVHLGSVRCWVRTPTGNVWEYEPTQETGWASSYSALDTLVRTDDGLGRYEVRWYSRREGERRREIARQRVTISADEPEVVPVPGTPWGLERR